MSIFEVQWVGLLKVEFSFSLKMCFGGTDIFSDKS